MQLGLNASPLDVGASSRQSTSRPSASGGGTLLLAPEQDEERAEHRGAVADDAIELSASAHSQPAEEKARRWARRGVRLRDRLDERAVRRQGEVAEHGPPHLRRGRLVHAAARHDHAQEDGPLLREGQRHDLESVLLVLDEDEQLAAWIEGKLSQHVLQFVIKDST